MQRPLKLQEANGVAMAEPAAGLLSPNLIDEFSSPYVQKIREAVEDENFMCCTTTVEMWSLSQRT